MGLNIAITSKYDPFTYEDYIKPLEGYWEDYDKAEQDIASAKSDLAKIDAYMAEVQATDKDLYDKYENYRKDLDAMSGSLSSSGLTADIRTRLRDLPTTYNSTILPIIEGLGKLNEYKKGVSDLRSKGVIVEEHEDNNKLSTHMGLNVPYANKTITKDEVAKLSEEMTQNITSQMDSSFIPGLANLVVTAKGIKPVDILNKALNGEQKQIVDTIRERIKASIASRLGVDRFDDLDQNVKTALSTEIDNGIITGATYATSMKKVGKDGDDSSNDRKREIRPAKMYVGASADLNVDHTKPESVASLQHKNAEDRFNDMISAIIYQSLPGDMSDSDKNKKTAELFEKYKSGTVHDVYRDPGGMYYYYVQIPKYKKEGNKYVEETDRDGNPIYSSIPVATSSYADQFNIPKGEKDPLSWFTGSGVTSQQ